MYIWGVFCKILPIKTDSITLTLQSMDAQKAQINEVMFVFPGQGSQALNMGKDVYENHQSSREVFEEVNDTLGYSLSDIIFGEDLEKLSLTEHAQPALMTVSIAVLTALKKETGKNIQDLCAVVAGHSLGEYSALCAAGVISVSDTAKLLSARGKAMSKAAPKGTGGMVALLGADTEKAKQLIANSAENETLVIANDNSVGQIVLSGHVGAVDRAVQNAASCGIKKAVKLQVSGPFHSPLMLPAASISELIHDTEFHDLTVKFIPNITAEFENEKLKIKDLLVKQVTGTVRWRESILFASLSGIKIAVELGSGKVLSGLIKKTTDSISCLSAETSMDVSSLVQFLG